MIDPPKTQTPTELPSSRSADPNLQSCEAILICLREGRFVIVRDEEPGKLWPINGGWAKLRMLRPGDEVVYKGQRTTVRAIDVYR